MDEGGVESWGTHNNRDSSIRGSGRGGGYLVVLGMFLKPSMASSPQAETTAIMTPNSSFLKAARMPSPISPAI